jgi:hypothetical protein
MNYRAKILSRLKKDSAFYEMEFEDGQRTVQPVGVDKFDDALQQVKSLVGMIYSIIDGRELYDLSNKELDQVKKGLDDVISWSKDTKARMRGKDYAGSASPTPGPEEFKADSEQRNQLDWENRKRENKNEAA